MSRKAERLLCDADAQFAHELIAGAIARKHDVVVARAARDQPAGKGRGEGGGGADEMF